MAQQQDQLKQLARELHWPRYLALTQHDHQLIFDLEEERDRLLLLEDMKGKTEIVLEEFPFADEKVPTVTDGALQPYVHQFLAAVYQEQPVYGQTLLPASFSTKPLMKKRKLVPGDGWLYFKIYCHPSHANSILVETLRPLFRVLEREGSLTQWFFVRYRDPDYHLRVRLCLAAGKAGSGDMLDRVSGKLGKLVQQGFVQDYQVAVYERELERYDPSLIEAVEQVFCASSALVASYIKGSGLAEGDETCNATAFRGLDIILDAFGLEVAGKVQLLSHLYASLYKEFGETKALKIQLASKYREMRKLPAVFPGKESDVLLAKLRLGRFESSFKAAVVYMAQRARLLSLVKQKQLISDLMHMHLNRLLVDQPRQQELVLYYCLWKHYQSIAARQK